MLSPSHPGPYKATHLAMCDRTVNFSRLKSAPVVSQFVRVERCSTSTQQCADYCAFPATDCAANYGTRASSDSGGQLVAMLIPE